MMTAILIALLSVIAYAGWTWTHRRAPRMQETSDDSMASAERHVLVDREVGLGPAARTIESALVTVATAMRSGAMLEAAWQRHAAIPMDSDHLPGTEALIDIARAQEIPDAIADTYARNIRAACQFAATTGAPLADVLDDIRAALGDLELARTERMTAMAGPRMTVRVLLVMPAIGVLFGMALGVDPVAMFLDGSLGTACLVTAVGLCAAGWAWSSRLIHRAEAAGGDTA